MNLQNKNLNLDFFLKIVRESAIYYFDGYKDSESSNSTLKKTKNMTLIDFIVFLCKFQSR